MIGDTSSAIVTHTVLPQDCISCFECNTLGTRIGAERIALLAARSLNSLSLAQD
jgi:hypothetical protein